MVWSAKTCSDWKLKDKWWIEKHICEKHQRAHLIFSYKRGRCFQHIHIRADNEQIKNRLQLTIQQSEPLAKHLPSTTVRYSTPALNIFACLSPPPKFLRPWRRSDADSFEQIDSLGCFVLKNRFNTNDSPTRVSYHSQKDIKTTIPNEIPEDLILSCFRVL